MRALVPVALLVASTAGCGSDAAARSAPSRTSSAESSGTSAGSSRASSDSSRTTSDASRASSGQSSASSAAGPDAAAPVTLKADYVLPDDQYPESGAYDPTGHAFFVGSLQHGDVRRVAADGTQTVFWAGTGESDRVTLGTKVDGPRRRVWVCSILNNTAQPGDVFVFDADTGATLADFSLGQTFQGASCNDLCLDGDGRAFVTDRENPNVYRVDLDASDVSIWASGPLLAPDVVGMNGAAFTPDGTKLIVTQYLTAKLIGISTAAPASMDDVKLSGDSFTGGDNVANGADGIVFVGDALYVAFGDDVMRVSPADATWKAATVKAQAVGTGYTAVTLAEGALYAIRGQSVAFQFGLAPDLPFDIRRVGLTGF